VETFHSLLNNNNYITKVILEFFNMKNNHMTDSQTYEAGGTIWRPNFRYGRDVWQQASCSMWLSPRSQFVEYKVMRQRQCFRFDGGNHSTNGRHVKFATDIDTISYLK
jgi:hypothetical protein